MEDAPRRSGHDMRKIEECFYVEISKETVSNLMIEKQGFIAPQKLITKNDVYQMVDRLGCIQIDTINVVERSHHLTLWSRLGYYDKEFLRDLAYVDRRLFEHWAHASSYIPLTDYRYFLHSMEVRMRKIEDFIGKWAESDPEIIDLVLERIRKEGPLAAKDFEHRRERPSGGWWDWKPAKVALEALFGAGILLISHRENFQRYYDLAERVLPAWVDTTEPTEDERTRFFILRTMGCLGLVKASDIRWYYLPWSTAFRKTSRQLETGLNGLVEEGPAARFDVEGEKKIYYCLATDADRVAELEEGDFAFDEVRFLTNFDNLLWGRKRVKVLFGFEAKLETYIPAERRKYGYYNLPILHGDRLVGRIVPRMDRDRQTLVIQSVWHEPWFEPDEKFDNAFSETMESFAGFNGAEKIELLEEKPRIG